MDRARSNHSSKTEALPTDDRLDSWKEIAAYLKRSVRTLHRWEKEEGLPVHRQLHKELGSAFAYKSELDAWSSARSARAEFQKETDEKAWRRRPLVTAALLCAVAVGLTGSVWYMTAGRSRLEAPQPNSPVTGLELISTFPGSHRWPSLSPDGRMVAFVSDAGGTPQIWIKNMATGNPIQITFGDISAVRPRWSPRGDRIVFTRRGGGIWSVPPLGGEPREVVENGSNADLSSDGHRLVYERSGQIVIAGADGRGAAALQLPRSLIPYYGDAWPTFSPDGKWIAVFLGEEGRYGDYWIIPSEGGEPRRLTSDFQEGGAPAWSPDGKSLVVPSARAGSVNLWRVPVGGGVPEALTTGTGEDLDPVVSHDGRALLFANVKRTWAMVVHDLNTGLRRTLLEERTPLVFPRYSPDGRHIALAGKDARGGMQLFVMKADGSNLTAVTDGASELNILPQWGGNGQALYFYQLRPTLTFRRVSVAGGASRQVARWSLRREYQAAVDPRERLVVYSAVEYGRLQESRGHDLESGRETRLPFALAEQRFSHDGRFIAGESRDHEVVVCETVGRCRVLTPKSARGLTTLAWSADDSRLFFLRHTSARVVGELTSVSIHGGPEKAHGPIGPFQRDFQMAMDVSPHDEIVFAACHESAHELWIAKLQ